MLLDLRPKARGVSNFNLLFGGFRLLVAGPSLCEPGAFCCKAEDAWVLVVVGWIPGALAACQDDAPSPGSVLCGSRPRRGAAQRLGWSKVRSRGWEVGVMRLVPGFARNIFLRGSSQGSGVYDGCTW